MSVHLLYDKPHPKGNVCALSITGALPPYAAGVAYRGTLDVSGAFGAVALAGWEGALPNGATVSYDSVNSQIVVAWPAFSSGTSGDIPNLDFQSGNVGFANGAGIDIRQIADQSPVDPNASADTYYMHYQDVGGESASMSQTYLPATLGKDYTASVDVWRASTRKHADGAAVRIQFYNADKVQVGGADGNVVKELTDRQWHTSNVSAQPPSTAAFVRLGVAFFRIHDNDEVLATNLAWNGAVVDPSKAQGTDGADPISLYVHLSDEMGCRATWAGTILGGARGAQFSDWRYKQIDAADDTDYSASNFDDSDWAVGAAPFGGSEDGATSWSPPHEYDPRFAEDFATAWTPHTRLWIRGTLALAEVPAAGYSILGYIEDNCHFYLNGVLQFSTPPTGDGNGSGFTNTLPASAFVVGNNVIAVRCDDEPPPTQNSQVYADFILEPIQ